MSAVSTKTPGPLRSLARAIKTFPYRGKGRFCPICETSSRKFRAYGIRRREDAQCVHCGSLERHRFLWHFLTERTDLFEPGRKTMLHVAPESCFEPAFRRRLGEQYLTADLYNPRAMVKMDITDIQYPDDSFDVIYCSHVLEHVLDDRQAMREFLRVLKPDGWAILLVPIGRREKTYEDPTIVDPQERLKHFGKEDHVRIYGPDYADRLREVGFRVKVTTMDDLLDDDQRSLLGLMKFGGVIHFCTRS